MRLFLLMSIMLGSAALRSQQPIGTILVEDATLTGDLSVTNGRAILLGGSSVVAKDHVAQLILTRGGSVSVCATSGLHITQSQAGAHPLMLALDRGAMEIHTAAQANDAILTPDLRFVAQSDGDFDLRLRVTRNGDTCVENRGANSPVLAITDAFTDALYELRRGQHVLFEHGSLKEVVDNESSPCGCPPALAPGISVAEALLAPGTPTTKQAEAQHPFPAAVSQGLAPPPSVPQSTAGVANAQVSTQLGFSGDGTGSIAGTATPAASAPPSAVGLDAPAPVQQKSGFGHRVGRFFKRLFGG